MLQFTRSQQDRYALVAQWIECLTPNEKAASSILAGRTIAKPDTLAVSGFAIHATGGVRTRDEFGFGCMLKSSTRKTAVKDASAPAQQVEDP